ncbi:MAG: glucose-6-phosphate isomerase [Spirochaetes bacterium]|nr:glucose-6-phosphate isomerase [Spirochaetota bacterium]
MAGIKEKEERFNMGGNVMEFYPGRYRKEIDTAIEKAVNNNVIERLWEHDFTLWKEKPDEITNRLGWLTIAERMKERIPSLSEFADEIRAKGYTQVLLLGMGGSSLAPEVFKRTFGAAPGYLDCAVLDSTDPEAVLEWDDKLDYNKTVFIVSTKSGGTVETLSFFKYFYNRTLEKAGKGNAGEHFIAVTDPGSKLVRLAENYNFLKIFLNDPDIGGRYSALSYFGLVPASLMGIKLDELIDRALISASDAKPCVCPKKTGPKDMDNNAARLGIMMGELARLGPDRITFILSEGIAGFGDWAEQLIAESTGKEGRGILPVVGEEPGEPSLYGPGRFFVYLRLKDDEAKTKHNDSKVAELQDKGFPVVRIKLNDVYDLGGQFFLWEFATALAGHVLGINPFDQPDVESAKVKAREMVALYKKQGSLGEDASSVSDFDEVGKYLKDLGEKNYVALQAYVKPSPSAKEALSALRLKIRNKYGLTVTAGFGPRFLHSTGQLHKGDSGKGFFIQMTSENPKDVPIPDTAGSESSGITFGILKLAQALGDKKALEDKGRKVVRLNLGTDAVDGIVKLMENL